MLVSVLQDLPLSYGSRHISCDCDGRRHTLEVIAKIRVQQATKEDRLRLVASCEPDVLLVIEICG